MSAPPMLELRSVTAGYGRTTVLRDVSLSVPEGRIAALLGPNGAGKTTLMRTAAGLMRPSEGVILIRGEDHTRSPAHARARAGVMLIPEGRGIFRGLTVRENLRMQVPPKDKQASIDAGIEAFPILGERLGQTAGTMSGGQQQMLALARCFIARPRLVLLDEVSMGLAPQLIDEIFAALDGLAQSGVALLLVEQYVSKALQFADEVHLLRRGTLTWSGPPSNLDEQAVVSEYLGTHSPDNQPQEDEAS